MMVVKESVELELVYGQIEKRIGGFEWLNQTRWVEASEAMMTEVEPTMRATGDEWRQRN